MGVSIPGGRHRRMPGDVAFKGSTGGLTVLIDDLTDFQQVLEGLRSKLQGAGSFFSGAEITVDLGRRSPTEEQLRELESVLTEHGVRLMGVVDGGSSCAGECPLGGEEGGEGAMVRSKTLLKGPSQEKAVPPPFTARSAGDSKADDDICESLPTLLVKKTIRSGQRVRYGGNVVVMGDVNPGGEITATGDVLVLGTLRGIAHAGAGGDDSAIVAAVRLNPVQLRIGRHFSRPATDEVAFPNSSGSPEIARVNDGTIVVERLGSLEEPRKGTFNTTR